MIGVLLLLGIIIGIAFCKGSSVCQKCLVICPKKNAHIGRFFLKGNEVWFTILLSAVLILAGL